MFALSYSAPQSRDPNLRDAYFLGQERGFAQIAEVAEDRNKKRQIAQQQQNINLARQQESRLQRQQQIDREVVEVNRRLKERELDIEDKKAPIIAAQSMLNLQNTQLENEKIRQTLDTKINNNDTDSKMNSALNNTLNLDTTNVSGGRLRKGEETVKIEETPQQKLEQMTSAPTEKTSRTTPIPQQQPTQEVAYTSQNKLLKSLDNRDRMRKLTEEAQRGEQAMLSSNKPINLNLISRGFGANRPLTSLDDEIDFTQYII
jgi:hypothetical protein